MFLCTAAFPCCVTGWVAQNTGRSALRWGLASLVAYPCVNAVLRTHVRQQYGMVGSCPLDWCSALSCPLCAAVQQAAEVRYRRKVAPDMDRDSEY